MTPTKSKIVLKTPKGPLTGSNPVNGFQIISINEFNNNPNIPDAVRYTPHELYFDLIIVITDGSGLHNVDFIDYEYQPGSVFTIKKNQYHHWHPNPDIDGFLIFFSKGFENNFIKTFESKIFSLPKLTLPKPLIFIAESEKQQSYFNLLHVIKQEFELKNYQILPFLITGFMVKLELDYINYFPSLKYANNLVLFQKFQKLLNNNIKSSRNGNYYVIKLNTTFNHLNAICKSVTSYSLKQYIDNYIITQSKILLNNHAKNISDIAFDLGFNEVGNFSKYFKKHTGQKPNEFRKNLML